MVTLEIVHAHNIFFAKTHALVAVICGEISGVGEGTARALARAYGRPGGKLLRIYFVGTRKEIVDRTIAYCQRVCPEGQFNFVQAQNLCLLEDVDRCSAEIIRSEEKEAAQTGERPYIDFLLHNSNVDDKEVNKMPQETSEGLVTLMSIVYYSRMRYIYNLLPLLNASDLPTGARVVLGLRHMPEKKVLPEELSVRDSKHYGIVTAGHVESVSILSHETLARRNPGLGFCFVYTGFTVETILPTEKLRWWARLLCKGVFQPILKALTTGVEEAGERTMFLLSEGFPARIANPGKNVKQSDDGFSKVALGSDGIVGSGAYRVGSEGEITKTSNVCSKLRGADVSEKIWEHTMAVFEEIEAKTKGSG